MGKKIIQDWWREWLENLASFYKVSEVKMFKTAFPPGWIGKYKKISQDFKHQIWIEPQAHWDSRKDKFNKVVTKTATDYYMTGSEMSSDGFIVESAGDTKLTFTGGGQVAASAVTAKTLYEIGVSRVSGSGTVHLVF